MQPLMAGKTKSLAYVMSCMMLSSIEWEGMEPATTYIWCNDAGGDGDNDSNIVVNAFGLGTTVPVNKYINKQTHKQTNKQTN